MFTNRITNPRRLRERERRASSRPPWDAPEGWRGCGRRAPGLPPTPPRRRRRNQGRQLWPPLPHTLGSLPKNHCREPKNLGGTGHDDMEGQEASPWSWRKVGACGDSLACCSARRNFAGWFWQSQLRCRELGAMGGRKNFGEEMALLLEKGNFDFLGCQPLLMPF